MSSKVPVDLLPINEESPPYTRGAYHPDSFTYPPIDPDRPGPSTAYSPDNPDHGKMSCFILALITKILCSKIHI